MSTHSSTSPPSLRQIQTTAGYLAHMHTNGTLTLLTMNVSHLITDTNTMHKSYIVMAHGTSDLHGVEDILSNYIHSRSILQLLVVT